MLINLTSLWFKKRSTQRLTAFYFSAAGAFVILVFGLGYELEYAGLFGLILIITGSLLGVFARRRIGVLVCRALVSKPTRRIWGRFGRDR
jgi:hypothetical protein